ncbi:hypothetical protein KAW50_08840 [candidate division WOR-3 bacterium]|nr:hypothetical protein [candidate division WOR-3 bacterium]
MEINPKEFQKSITRELDTIKNRVRNLIGDAHWGEEGRYKEAILRNSIKRFLPSNLSIGTGFVVSGYNRRNVEEIKVSNQIDIIVFDNTCPVLFCEGDFVITTRRNVRAIIEVKTRIRNADLSDIIPKSINNGRLLNSRSERVLSRKMICNRRQEIFNGILSFEYDDDPHSSVLESALKQTEGYVNHIALGKDYFIKYWRERTQLVNPVECDNDFYNIYKLKDLSFSYFISNLMMDCTSGNKLEDRLWILFPLQETKEAYREKTICLDSTQP